MTKKNSKKLAKKVFLISKKNLSGLKIEKIEKEREAVKKTKIRIIGIGGGGGNIVSEIASKVKRISFVAANTDSQALKIIPKNVLPFQFGEFFTQGLGTGMNYELAERAALAEKEKIKKLFHGFDFCILVTCLGGGVSSGAGPVFAKIAKNSGTATLGVFTLPFKFEGEKKQEIAWQSLQKLKPHLNTIAILPNDKIFQIIEKNTPLKEAFSAINKNLAESLAGLIETIYLPGLINIDFADLKTILQGYGKIAYLNSVEGQGNEQVLKTLEKALNSPLYPYSIRGAKRILFNITGDKNLSLSEISQISKIISSQVFSGAKIIFGISQGKKYQNKIKISLLATGCLAKEIRETSLVTRHLKGDFYKKTQKPKKINQKKKIESKKKIEQKIKQKPKLQTKEKTKPKSSKKSKTNFAIEPKPEIEVKKIQVQVVPEKPPIIEEEKPKIRKTALQVKEEIEEAEKEFLEKEKFWETPAFLRNQSNNK